MNKRGVRDDRGPPPPPSQLPNVWSLIVGVYRPIYGARLRLNQIEHRNAKHLVTEGGEQVIDSLVSAVLPSGTHPRRKNFLVFKNLLGSQPL